MNVDCVIVGGGVAGLVTARELVARGHSCVVLEARDRVGGRTLSLPFGDARLDLGGQWIGQRQRHIRALVGELGLATFAQYHDGAKIMMRAGKRRLFKGALPRISPFALADLFVASRRLARGVADLRAGIAPIADWDAITLESWLRARMKTETGRGMLRAVARCVLAAEPSEMSFAFFVDYLRRGHSLEEVAAIGAGAQETRIVTGMQSVSETMAAALGDRVRLAEPALAIEQGDREVAVRTARGGYRAPLVVISAPPALCDRIHYTSALPARRDAAIQRLPMGSAIKYVVQYERAFWRTAGLSGEASSDGGILEMVVDGCSVDGNVAALVGFTVGAAARRWADAAPEQRRAAVIAELVALYGPEAGRPIRFEAKSWLDDPWSRGCYVGVAGPGAWHAIAHALRQPIGRIHWAGGETAEDWPGVDGAVQSGHRAAAEIHARLAVLARTAA